MYHTYSDPCLSFKTYKLKREPQVCPLFNNCVHGVDLWIPCSFLRQTLMATPEVKVDRIRIVSIVDLYKSRESLLAREFVRRAMPLLLNGGGQIKKKEISISFNRTRSINTDSAAGLDPTHGGQPYSILNILESALSLTHVLALL